MTQLELFGADAHIDALYKAVREMPLIQGFVFVALDKFGVPLRSTWRSESCEYEHLVRALDAALTDMKYIGQGIEGGRD